jgi:hypothetical protein
MGMEMASFMEMVGAVETSMIILETMKEWKVQNLVHIRIPYED